jgi:cell division protein FtsN
MAPIADPPAEGAKVVERADAIPPPAPLSQAPASAAMKRASEIAAAAAALLVSPAAAAEAPPRSTAGGPFYVQAGSFADNTNAEALYRGIQSFGRAAIVPSESGGRWLYRVRIGPIASREEASGILQDLMSRGVDGAQILRE